MLFYFCESCEYCDQSIINFASWPQKLGFSASLRRSCQEIWEWDRPTFYLCELLWLDGCVCKGKNNSVSNSQDLPPRKVPKGLWRDVEYRGCHHCIQVVRGLLLYAILPNISIKNHEVLRSFELIGYRKQPLKSSCLQHSQYQNLNLDLYMY